jgi:hypothetical protein
MVHARSMAIRPGCIGAMPATTSWPRGRAWPTARWAVNRLRPICSRCPWPGILKRQWLGTSACSVMMPGALRLAVSWSLSLCQSRGTGRRPCGGSSGGGRLILWGGGAGNFTKMASLAGAPVEGGDGARAHQWARHPGLGGMSSATPW